MRENKPLRARLSRRIKALGAGALAGIVAALLMTLVLLVLRSQAGVPTPSELVGDRIAQRYCYGFWR